jgi:hypothetical protein
MTRNYRNGASSVPFTFVVEVPNVKDEDQCPEILLVLDGIPYRTGIRGADVQQTLERFAAALSRMGS